MSALFACSRCFSRHPFEELSQGQQLCKECRGAFPIVKCTYCRSEFQQESKGNTSTICKKCEFNVKQYGKPSACEYCNIIAAFIGNKCQRCTNSEKKYGPPVTCEQCKQKCAFDRKDEDKKKVDGKMLCWLCTLSYRRALAKTKHSERGSHSNSSKTKEQHQQQHRSSSHNHHGNHHNHHDKRPQRPDVTKVGLGDREETGPPAKIFRPMINRDAMVDPNSSDHVVAITELREQVATLQKQLSVKDNQLLAKEKQITELKAGQFRMEQEHRVRVKTIQKEHEAKVDILQERIKTYQREVATLNKANNKHKSDQQKQLHQQQKSAANAIATAAASLGQSSNSTPGGSKSRQGSGSDSDNSDMAADAVVRHTRVALTTSSSKAQLDAERAQCSDIIQREERGKMTYGAGYSVFVVTLYKMYYMPLGLAMYFIEDDRKVADRPADNQMDRTFPPKPSGGIAAVVPDLQETMCMLQMMSADGPLADLKPKTALSGISMPGIGNIFGDTNPSRRIVWILVIVAAFVIAIIQVKDRVEYYSSTPVTVNVRVTMNDTLRFPVLTVCNKNSFNMSQIRLLEKQMTGSVSKLEVNISQLVGLRGMDAKQLWDLIAHDPDQFIVESV
uniref:EOG090X02IW n=1 Tax=Daphnia similis TaxID=35528 RepID=A0A4Y7MZF7_9CRUS|nr:EOG090X02IW [Daphnia similis]SVE87262.1 EOG090X02IW [Daphnia similis]